MTTDYRALCAELLAAIQLYTKLNPAASDMSPFELTEKLMDAMAATNAALAQPVAEGPTDEELDSVMFQAVWECMHNADNMTNDEMDLLKARAVLAKWGNQ